MGDSFTILLRVFLIWKIWTLIEMNGQLYASVTLSCKTASGTHWLGNCWVLWTFLNKKFLALVGYRTCIYWSSRPYTDHCIITFRLRDSKYCVCIFTYAIYMLYIYFICVCVLVLWFMTSCNVVDIHWTINQETII